MIFLLRKNRVQIHRRIYPRRDPRIFIPSYIFNVSSISLHGILESTDALEADTYDTRCNRGNTIKRICAPQPGAIESRRNVP